MGSERRMGKGADAICRLRILRNRPLFSLTIEVKNLEVIEYSDEIYPLYVVG